MFSYGPQFADVTSVGGFIFAPLPSAEPFQVMGTFGDNTLTLFASNSFGEWCVGAACDTPEDFGITSSYSQAAAVGAVPEPMPVALLAGGLLAALVARRKRD